MRLSSMIARSLALLTLGGQAAADDDLLFADLPVVATVSRLPQRLADAPTSMTVIDRDTLRASGARSLNDVFRLVPGFQTFAHNAYPARVTYHGLTDDVFTPRVQVLVDGRSLYSPLFFSGVNWAILPVAIDDIERIEVVRGTNTVSYGTNAFMGVINIVTVDPSLVQKHMISLNRGNQGINDQTLRTGGALGEAGHFRITLQQIQDDGLKDQANWQDAFHTRLADFRATLQLTLADSLDIHAGQIRGVTRLGRTGRIDDPLRDFAQQSGWIQGRWLRALSDTADFSLRLTHGRDEASDFFHIAPLNLDLNMTGDWGERTELEAVHTFSPFIGGRMAWGASWRQDQVSSATMYQGKVNREVSRIFGNIEWKPNMSFTGNAGTSHEQDSLAGNHLSSRFSLAWHVDPENTLRLGWARAWRTASMLEYRINDTLPGENIRTANPDLPAERLDVNEIGYLGNWHALNASLDVRLFQERLADRIYSEYNAPVQAVQDVTIRGMEYQFKWQPVTGTRLALAHADVNINSQMLGNLHADYAGDAARIQLLTQQSAPRYSTSFLWMQTLPAGFEASLARYWVDDIKWSKNTSAEGFVRTDLRIAKPFRLASQRAEVALTVQSLGGAYKEFVASGDPADRIVDRRTWLTLRTEF